MDNAILEAILYYLFYYTGKCILLIIGLGKIKSEKVYNNEYDQLWNYRKLIKPVIIKNDIKYLVFEWVIILGFCCWVILGITFYFIKNH
jgi:hypothetical protein